MRTLIGSLVILLSCLQLSFAAVRPEMDQSDLGNLFREFLEGYLRPQFDQKVKDTQREMAQRLGHPMSADEMITIISSMKTLFYNRAYVLYICFKEYGPESLDDCNDKFTDDFTKSLINIAYLNRHGRNRPDKCDVDNRLYLKEVEFPPFDFLKEAHLYNLESLAGCLASGAR